MGEIYDATRWYEAAQSGNPYPVLLLGRSREQYYREGRVDAQRLLKPQIDDVLRYHPHKGIRIVELGSGLHRFPIALQELKIIRSQDEIVAVDIVEEFLKAAPPEVHQVIDILDIPSNSIDFLYSQCVFQHLTVQEIEFYTRQIRRVVCSGGRIFIQFPNAASSYYWERPGLHRFTEEEIRALFPRGWRVDVKPGNMAWYFLLKRPEDYHKENRELFLIAQRK